MNLKSNPLKLAWSFQNCRFCYRITITTKGKYTAINAGAIEPLVSLVDDDKSEVRINALKVSLVTTKSCVCVCMCICMHVFVCMCAQSYIPLYLHICTDLTTAKFLIHSIPNQSTNFTEHLTLCL